MIGIIFILAFLIIALAYVEEYLGEYKKYIYIGIGAVLILLAATKEVGIDNDSKNYEYFFLHYDDPILSKTVEFSFLYLCKILYSLFKDVHSIFFIYALIGISLKMIAIRKLSKLYFLPLLIYISYYYILHDLTQIRAAVASGFFLLALSYQIRNQKKIAFTLLICATFFHYSALCLFPILFIGNKDMSIKSKVIWGSIVPFAYFIYFLHINLILIIPIPFIANKIETYQQLMETGKFGDEINVFNLVLLVRIAIFYYNLYFIDTIKEKCSGANLIVKIEGLSLACFPGLAVLPVMAFRISELYGIVDIIAMTYIYYTIKQKNIAKTIVSIIGISLLLINLFYVKLLSL